MSSDLIAKNTTPRGLLNEEVSLKHFKVNLHEIPKGLEGLVSKFWYVEWELADGQTYRQSALPHPVQHIVLDPSRGSGLYGCSTKKFDYAISGKGQAIGLKIIPGMGRAFTSLNMTSITDSYLPLGQFTSDYFANSLEAGLREQGAIPPILNEFGQSITEIAGSINQSMKDARDAVQMIESSKNIFTAKDVSKALNLSLRQVQRIFSTHVGVSPKWVIDCYRMLEAMDTMNSKADVNIAEMALNLEYSDQSHFSNKFKAIAGISPSAYIKKQRL